MPSTKPPRKSPKKPDNVAPEPFVGPEVLEILAKTDAKLAPVIRAVGPCILPVKALRSPAESLMRAVAHQQLHGKAAETILARFCALAPHVGFPRPVDVVALDDLALRGVGFSNAKVRAIRDIAERALDGTIPSKRALTAMDDDAIVATLTQVRGVGRWTVEMLLMFQLGRQDIFPADDFGVRNGHRITHGLGEMPTAKAALAHAERYRPYRTIAAWYFWRAVDLDKARVATIA